MKANMGLKKHSTELAVLELIDRVTQSLDSGRTPINIYLDLSNAFDTLDHSIQLVKNPWTGLKYVHVNFMFNLQHFAIHNVSSAILYGAIGIGLLVVRQNSYGFERSGPRQCDV